jgi:hypothetical protein
MLLIDVKLMVNRQKRKGHFWDQKTFNKAGYPVALCNENLRLFPRSPVYFMTPTEMKQVPFCQDCLNLVER